MTALFRDTLIPSRNEEFKVPAGGEIVLSLPLNKAFYNVLKENTFSATLELYLRCKYKNIFTELMNTPNKRLKVSLPPPKDKLRFVSAAPGHVLLGVYDAETGDIYYFEIERIQSPTEDQMDYTAKEADKDLIKARKDVRKLANLFYSHREYELIIHKMTGGAMHELKKRMKQTRKHIGEIYRDIVKSKPEVD